MSFAIGFSSNLKAPLNRISNINISLPLTINKSKQKSQLFEHFTRRSNLWQTYVLIRSKITCSWLVWLIRDIFIFKNKKKKSILQNFVERFYVLHVLLFFFTNIGKKYVNYLRLAPRFKFYFRKLKKNNKIMNEVLCNVIGD